MFRRRNCRDHRSSGRHHHEATVARLRAPAILVFPGESPMMTPETIENGLAQLAEELGTQTDFPRRVLDEIRNRAAAPTPAQNGRRVWFVRRLLIAASALGLLVAIGSWWLSAPVPLYARVLEVLERAQTVHVTGWTRDVFRKWPLENPVPGTGGPQVRHTVEAWYWTAPPAEPAS